MARPVLAIGGVALIGVGALIAVGWFTESNEQRERQITEQVRTVRLANDSGSVDLRVGDVAATTVRQRFSYRWSKPSEGFQLDGDQLVLGDCGWNCSVDYDVVVPPGTTVTGHVDSGDIQLDGVASADVTADSGSVKVRNVAGPLNATVDSGDIEGDHLGGKVDARADSGSVKLRLEVAQDVRVRVDSGNVDLTVPKGSYRVEGNSDSGNRDIKVTSDSSALRTLQLDADSGDVTVRPA
jgi:hypothetical protein